IRFFEQAHMKDAAAYLKFVINPRDEISFKRLVQLLPGIGGKGADKLWKCFAGPETASSARPDESFALQPGPAALAIRLQSCAALVPKKAAVAWAQFVATISQLQDEAIRNQPAKMLRLAIEAEYEDHLKENYANYRSRLE